MFLYLCTFNANVQKMFRVNVLINVKTAFSDIDGGYYTNFL